MQIAGKLQSFCRGGEYIFVFCTNIDLLCHCLCCTSSQAFGMSVISQASIILGYFFSRQDAHNHRKSTGTPSSSCISSVATVFSYSSYTKWVPEIRLYLLRFWRLRFCHRMGDRFINLMVSVSNLIHVSSVRKQPSKQTFLRGSMLEGYIIYNTEVGLSIHISILQ